MLLQEVTKGAGRTGPGSSPVVRHHPDCAIHHCYHRAPGLLAEPMGVSAEHIDAKAVTDPYSAVALDVQVLRARPRVSGGYAASSACRACRLGGAGDIGG
ncbi:MAG: hypothetical protein JO224_09070 [Pelomonas sp.]|nr:hypothetical protein [Roseateles sp.]